MESSVNITNGQSSIVRVQHNKIVGRLEFVGESSSYGPSSSSQHSPSRGGAGIIDGSPRVSPQRDSPARYRKISCDERECESCHVMVVHIICCVVVVVDITMQ